VASALSHPICTRSGWPSHRDGFFPAERSRHPGFDERS
jgi:hypothetical protein